VRQSIRLAREMLSDVQLIANFAAVHREPGHEHSEYFETNLRGATNVCQFAEEIGCNNIVFSSSISVYGPVVVPTDESALPKPTTAYGASKLAAELIHQAWRDRARDLRRLLIVRPGVVFGEGEGGNVTRLIRAMRLGLFAFAGNRDVRKAGIYVKELCQAMWWLHQRQASKPAAACVANLSMNPGPTLGEYVDAIRSVGRYRAWTPEVPARVLLVAATLFSAIGKPFGLFKALHVDRVRKTLRSNNIVPQLLADEGYLYRFSLNQAFLDWLEECPADWRGAAR
jgi:GlcNAc-P-P-Und epimerase